MSKKQEERNNLIIRLFIENKRLPEVKEELKRLGYAAISKNRIWSIWRQSEHYRPRRERDVFCSFCLINKPRNLIIQLREFNNNVKAKMCNECYERLLPSQPLI